MVSRIELLGKVRNLPDSPGVYRFLNADNQIIYIGKAKNLRKRVGSYFASGRPHSYRISHMVQRIADLAYTVTNSEVEALLLENNLIKNNQPRYNILLKDGKTYPYICIKNERFPRVFSTRSKLNDGSTYYGPYPSVGTMKAILELIRGFIPLRNCNFHLSEKNIKAGKFRRCLEFQIGNCAGPCEGLMDEETYMVGIEQIRHILRGHLNPVIKDLETKMYAASEKLEFEQAEFFKRRLEKVKSYKKRSTVVSEKIQHLEVFAIDSEDKLAIINHFRVQDGAIVQTHSWESKRAHQEEPEEILAATINKMLVGQEVLHHEVVANIELPADTLPEGYTLTVPKIGDKRHLVDLGLKNCRTLLTEKLYKQNFKQRRPMSEIMMEALQVALHLKEMPDHIECFDNSNFQGTSPVASCVVFRDGKASKKDYRHFNIKTVEGPDDFASMKEVVGRRYKRMLDEAQELPKLIVIDGGKGQLSHAAEALEELGILKDVFMIGIAKRLEEIYRVGDPFPLYIDKKSPALQLIQQVRNEAHRFAITFHRQKRAKAPGQRSALTNLKGIGPAAEQEIIRIFRSIKKLKAAPQAERVAKLGAHRAAIIAQAIEKGEI